MDRNRCATGFDDVGNSSRPIIPEPFGGRNMHLAEFTGIGAFGREYRAMMANDAHAPGSVDRALANAMVRLCAETADYLCRDFTPKDVLYEEGSRPELDSVIRDLRVKNPTSEGLLGAIIDFTWRLGDRAEQDLTRMHIGGTEEEIITFAEERSNEKAQ